MKTNITPTTEAIYAEWEKRGRSEKSRQYLGASIAGNECDMYLWLYFRGLLTEKFDGHMYRLFNRGQREEAVFCEDLRSIGCEVKEVNPDTGLQWEVKALGGHFSGHLDCILRGLKEAPKTWHVGEFKTHNEDSYKKLVKEGVKKAKPMHYAQMQLYMGNTGITRALYLAVNKNTDELWTERVEFDRAFYEMEMARIKRIIDAVQADRCATRPDDFRCKMCPAAETCWHKSKCFVDPSLKVECRTCCHSTADTEHDGATWTCNLNHSCGVGITCADHIWLPSLVKAEIDCGDEKSITYRCGELKFTNGGQFASDELQKFGPDELDGILKVGGKVISSNALEKKYDGADVAFEGTLDELRGYCAGSLIAHWSKPNVVQEHNGKKYFEYNEVLMIIEGNKAVVKYLDPPF